MLSIRGADDTSDVRGLGNLRSMSAGSAGDAGEPTREAVYAGAEEGDCSNPGPGERQALCAVARPGITDYTRSRSCRAVNASEKVRDRAQPLRLAIDASVVEGCPAHARPRAARADDSRKRRIYISEVWPLVCRLGSALPKNASQPSPPHRTDVIQDPPQSKPRDQGP